MANERPLSPGAATGEVNLPPSATFRVLSPRWHGLLDFGAAAALLVAPFLIGLGSTAPDALGLSLAAGAALIVYSLLTDYDFSVASLISIRTHLALDVAAGVALLVAPLLFGFEGAARAYFLVMGLGVLGVVAVTNPAPERAST